MAAEIVQFVPSGPTIRQTWQARQRALPGAALVAGGVTIYGFTEGHPWAKWVGLASLAAIGAAWWGVTKQIDMLSAEETQAMLTAAQSGQIATGLSHAQQAAAGTMTGMRLG